MDEFPVKIVLLEYSPRQKRVFVRGVWSEARRPRRMAPIAEDNQQNYVRVHEGFDNLERGLGFSGLIPEAKTQR